MPLVLKTLKFSCSIATTCLILKIAPSVLFLRIKHSLTSPSHSVKFMGGGGYLGSILTTLDSTLGGGLKLFLDTLIRWSTLASNYTLTDSLQYISLPGLATRRIANSRWNISTAHLNIGLC